MTPGRSAVIAGVAVGVLATGVGGWAAVGPLAYRVVEASWLPSVGVCAAVAAVALAVAVVVLAWSEEAGMALAALVLADAALGEVEARASIERELGS